MKISPDIKQKHEEMFYPTVRVRTNISGGSGTVVYSKKYKGEVYTYVITNHHVIAECITVKKNWNPVLKRKVDTETLDTVQVEYFKYNNYSHCIGSFAVEADIVAYSDHEGGEDWALLRVRDKERTHDSVVKIFPIDKISSIHIFDKVYACGACFLPKTKITTDVGIKHICNIEIGDKVLTHDGTFQKVERVHKSIHDDVFVELKYGAFNTVDRRGIKATPGHQILVTNDDENMVWKKIIDVEIGDFVVTKAHACAVCDKSIPTFWKLCENCNPAQQEYVKDKVSRGSKIREELFKLNKLKDPSWKYIINLIEQKENNDVSINKQISDSVSRTLKKHKHFNEDILPKSKELEDQGFRCIPIGNGPVVPDIIAIKDNMVFAVEVENGLKEPNFTKYQDTGAMQYYDDIMWIVDEKQKTSQKQKIAEYKEYPLTDEFVSIKVLDKQIIQPKRTKNTVYNLTVENNHTYTAFNTVVKNSLGHPPIATEGHISYMDDEIDHYKYWMSTAQTIFGNSGGSIYRWSQSRKQYEYIGIPSRISIQPMGFSADAITHMGYFIPIDRIYNLLESNNYNFIYDSSIPIKECEEKRKNVSKPVKEKDE
ncbi:hypothetical protein HN615_09520 [Candidatus Woesearchaeota archaeon]|jgi:hypothetical protein|nr:hypothetical protein [Candidatus Woesearchaeota archaeon]